MMSPGMRRPTRATQGASEATLSRHGLRKQLLLCGSFFVAVATAAPTPAHPVSTLDPNVSSTVHTHSNTSSALNPNASSTLADGVPDVGWPSVAIVGMGKCGTNALAAGLERLGLKQPDWDAGTWAAEEAINRQGFVGEINWRCNKFMTEDGLYDYRRRFQPPGPNW